MIDRRQTEVLRRVLATERLDIHTAIPGTVRSYDAATQTAEIVLGLREVAEAGDDDSPDTVAEYPILPAVPVCFPGGGGYAVHFPLDAGDPGLVVFAEGDISKWLETGEPSDPGVSERHGLSGGTFFPGLRTIQRRSGSAGSGGLRLGREGGAAIVVTESAVTTNAPIEANGNSDAAARSSIVDAEFTKIKATLDSLSGSASFGVPYSTPIDTASADIKMGS